MLNTQELEDRYKRVYKTRSRRFFSLYASTIIILVSILMFFYGEKVFAGVNVSAINVISFIIFVVGLGVLLNTYLQSSFRMMSIREENIDPSRVLDARLRRDVENRYRTRSWYHDDDDDEPVFTEELESLKELVLKNQAFEFEYAHCLETLHELQSKIRRQIERVVQNANLNLIIGILTTFVALTYLGYAVYINEKEFTSIVDLSSYYLPRISLVILIELFSFFFLRLYRSNLDDIKYFQNEVTNIDTKISALKASLLMKNDEDISLVVKILANTERNFVLKKGETTLELERSKIRDLDDSRLFDMLKNISNKYTDQKSSSSSTNNT